VGSNETRVGYKPRLNATVLLIDSLCVLALSPETVPPHPD